MRVSHPLVLSAARAPRHDCVESLVRAVLSAARAPRHDCVESLARALGGPGFEVARLTKITVLRAQKEQVPTERRCWPFGSVVATPPIRLNSLHVLAARIFGFLLL